MNHPDMFVFSRRSLLVGMGVATALLTACGPPPRASLPPLSWTDKPVIRLAAQGPDLITRSVSPRHAPHVEHLMPVSPERAIRMWVKERLQTTGVGLKTVKVILKDASVIEVPLKTQKGVKGFFMNQPDIRYDAKVDVVVQLVNADGTIDGQTSQSVWRSTSIDEKATVAEREKAWYALINALMTDLDEALERGIRGYLTHAVMP